MYDGGTVKTNNDGNDLPDGNPVMDTPSGSGPLPFRLEQALLTEGQITSEQLIVTYEWMDAQLNFISASLRQDAIAAPSRVATDTFNEL